MGVNTRFSVSVGVKQRFNMLLFFLILQLSMQVAEHNTLNLQEITSGYSFMMINFCGFLLNVAGLISQNQSNMADTVQYGRP